MLRTTAVVLIFVGNARQITLFFLSIIFHKNPRLIFAQNLKTMPATSSNKKIRNEKNIFQNLKATNSVLIQNDETLVNFRYIQAKYCNDTEIIECCSKLRKQLINIWMFSS